MSVRCEKVFSGAIQMKLVITDIADFSFNISGGRCECCGGAGIKKIEISTIGKKEGLDLNIRKTLFFSFKISLRSAVTILHYFIIIQQNCEPHMKM